MLGDKDAVAKLAVKDLETGRRFYQEILGLQEIGREGEELIVFRSGQSTLNVYRSRFAGTNQATAVTWDVGERLEEVVGQLKAKMPPTTPTLPRIPGAPQLLTLRLISPLPSFLGLLPRLMPNPLALGTEATAVLRHAQRPPSVFAREWAALRAAAREPEPFARALETRTYLGVVARIVSPAAAEAVRGLEDVLARLDESIQKELGRHPVRDLPDPTELAPVIRRLRVRGRGVAPDALRGWVDELRSALSAAPYPVPAEG